MYTLQVRHVSLHVPQEFHDNLSPGLACRTCETSLIGIIYITLYVITLIASQSWNFGRGFYCMPIIVNRYGIAR